MKKILSFILAFMLVLTMSVSVFAVDYSDITLDYSLSCDGTHSKTVPTGTVLTVEYEVENITSAEAFSVYVIQNEIYYDHKFFELDEDSIELEITTSTVKVQTVEGEDRKPVKEIYINDRTTTEYQDCQLVASFDLKVIAESGSSTIKSTSVKAYADENTMYRVSDSLSHLTVTVGEAGGQVEMTNVSFVSNGETENMQAAIGEEITIPGAPDNVPEGKVFDYWQAKDGTKYNPGDKYTVNGNDEFTAVFKDNTPPETIKYTLTFETNGGNTIAPEEKTNGSVVNLSSYNPTRSGYDFEGWFSDSSLTNKITSVTMDSDKTVYAKWDRRSSGGGSAITKYTLTFDTNGGSEVGTVSKIRNTTVDLSKYITQKDGYSFDGWYTDEDLTNKVTEIKITSNTTLYAKWVEGDNGENQNPNYKPDIMTGEHFAYIVGSEDGYIYPNRNLTRAEAATIFFRLLDENVRNEAYTKDNTFDDVNKGDWFNTAVSTLANLEIIKGRASDIFAPNEPITRAELATIVARLSEATYSGDDLFTDIKGHWAEDYINIAASINWIQGYEGRFRPDDNITRAEVMTLINRVLNRQPDSVDDLLPDMITFPDNADTTAWYYIAVQEATNSHEYELEEDGVHGRWTELTENPDWSKIED